MPILYSHLKKIFAGRFSTLMVSMAAFALSLLPVSLRAQAPTLNYASPQTYTVGTAITPLSPTTTGVGSPGYNTLIWGSGFNKPYGVAVDAAANVYVADTYNQAVKKIPAGGGTPVTIYSGYACAGIAVDAAGNVYAANINLSTLDKIPAGGGASVNLAIGLTNPMGVAVDAAGNIYVSTGSDNSVHKIPPAGGNGTVIASGFTQVGGVALDAAGNLYIADTGADAIFKLTAGANQAVKIATVTKPVGIAVDGGGDIYVGDIADNTVVEIPANGGAQIATTTGYAQPGLLACDTFGNVFIPYAGTSTVLEMQVSGGYYTGGLPQGLFINRSTGAITGTPSAGSVAADYKIRAYNSGGNATATVNMQVTGSGKLSGLTIGSATLIPAFDPATVNYSTAVAAAQQTLTVTPLPVDASASIAVIKGSDTTLISGGPSVNVPLSVGSNTIKILITPVSGAPFAYTVTASRPSASAPTLSYSSPQVYPVGTPIPAISPTSSNVFGIAYDSGTFNANNLIAPYGVATDAAGNVYVAEVNGYLSKYPTGGGNPVKVGPVSCLGVAVDAAGSIYASNFHNIVKITPDGTTTTVASGLNQPVGVAVDRAGNIYTADYQDKAIYKIPADGSPRVTLASGYNYVSGVAVDAEGTVFFTDGVRNNLNIVTTDGQVMEYRAGLSTPTGVCIDGTGNIYVTNSPYRGGNTLELIPPYGGSINIIAGGTFMNGSIASAVDIFGNVYIACGGNGNAAAVIRKLTPTGGYLANTGLPAGLRLNTSNGVISGTPTVAAAATNYAITAYNTSGSVSALINFKITGIATLSGLGISSGAFLAPFSPNTTNYSVGVSNDQKVFYVMPTAIDKTATIKVNGQTVLSGTISQGIPLSVGSNTVSIVVTTVDGTVKTYTLSVGRGASFASYPGPQTWYKNMAIASVSPITNGAGIAAPGFYSAIIASGLSRPGKLAVDKVGNIYLCDNNILKKIPAGNGAIVNIPTGIGILTGVDVDATGNIYLSDLVGGNIKKISAATGAISTIASGLQSPSDVAVDAAGNVFFVEEGGNSLKKLPAGGGSITSLATVTYPVALAMDAIGNFYVADGLDGTVLKVAAGGGTPVTIGSGFNIVKDVAVDASGNVYVTEGSGTAVKLIAANGGAPVSVLPFSGQAEAGGITIDASANIFYCNYFSQSSVANITKNARVGGYYATDMLPAGVTVNDTTGVISGTPTAGSPAKNYNIMGYNSLGGNFAPVNIRVKSSYLTNLTLSNGALSPAFSIATASYATTVCNATNTITVTPTAAAATAVIKVNGAVVASGTPSGAIPLNVGTNAITVTSIATDTSSYTLTIARLPGPGVTIAGAFCQSCSPQTLIFKAKVTNGGPTSSYTWYKNNIVVGTNDSTYTDNALVANDKIWCAIVSTATCVLSNGTTSNVVTLAAPNIVSVSPSTGPVGTLVTVNGTNFETLTALSIGGAPAIPVYNTGTQLTAMIMPAATTGAVTATTIYGTATRGTFTVVTGKPPGTQQGAKLTIAGTPASSGLGRIVAISADGNTAIANTGGSAGGVAIFTRSISIWVQQARLVGTGASGNAGQGSSVALSADGNTAVVGGANDNNTQGAVWVFVRSNGIWTQQGNKLTGSDASSGAPGSSFGSAVSLSADGNTALIGGTNDNSYTGAAWIFNRAADGTWTQTGSKLTATGTGGIAMLGNAVALSADGKTAVVGGHNESGRAGGVWIFTNNNGTWVQQGGKLIGTGTTGTTGAEQGVSVAVSADGNTAFWGGFHDGSSMGACWIFTRSGTVWTQQGAKLVGTGIVTSPGKTIINFGQSVGLSADGNTAVAGAPNDNNFTGALWVFTRSNGTWSQRFNKLTGAGEVAGAASLPAFGQAVALSADGGTAIAGDPADNSSAGALWAFVPLSGTATLAGLSLSKGVITPAFAAAKTAYATTVTNTTVSVTVTPVTTDAGATATVNNTAVPSGTASAAIPLVVGPNTITAVVTAADGVTTKTYTVTITRLPSSDATLATLTYTPVITKTTVTGADYKDYVATVPNTYASIAVIPVVNEPNATVKVNGITVASGVKSALIPLNAGDNIINTVITAQDGTTTKTYSLMVTRLPSGNAVLSTLKLNPVSTLTVVTGSDYKDYTTTVPNSESTVMITPTAQDTTATIKVNGVTVASGAASAAIPLNAGDNIINTVVTAQDGTTVKTYSIKFTRLPSSNANLAGLTLSSGTLSPVFAAGTTSYTASVSSATASVTVTPTVQDTTATIKINGTTVAPGSASAALPLVIGQNIITTVVTAQNGVTTKTYTVTVTVSPASNNAILSSLKLTPATTIAVVSGPDYRDYATTVPNSESTVKITPVAQDDQATMKVNGVTVASGAASASIPLNVGDNIINTIVTAGDGTTVKTYSIKFTRLPSTNASLAGLTLSSGTLSPVFAAGTISYTASVSIATTSVTVTPTVQDATATIKVNGTTVASGGASAALPLVVGQNVITTVVTAQNGTTTQTYAVTVLRVSNNAILSSLKLTPATTITVVSGPDYRDYATTAPNGESTVKITPAAQDATATIKVNGVIVVSGATSAAIPLNVGDNIINTVVTAGDGTTVKTYSIKLTRQPPAGAALLYTEAAGPVVKDALIVHQNVSPNGDGNSDVWVIDGITTYPENNVQIMSRNGVLVYEAKGYDNTTNAFDGHSSTNGKLQQAGTYFYSLEYKDGNETKHKTGFIVLKY